MFEALEKDESKPLPAAETAVDSLSPPVPKKKPKKKLTFNLNALDEDTPELAEEMVRCQPQVLLDEEYL